MRLVFLFLLLSLLALGCETAPESGGPASALAPGPLIRGGLTAPAVPGVPGGPPAARGGPFTQLRGPVAVAAAGQDIYIADAGLGQIFRAEPFGNRLTPIGPRGVTPGTRLAADLDGSLFVLDPPGRRIQRLARDGRLLQSFTADATVASLRDLALDPTRGRLLAADALNRQLVAFRPLGVSFELLPLRGEPRHQIRSFDAIAVAPDALYAIDARCPCLARLAFDGRVLDTFGHERLAKPERLAADRQGRLFVTDGAERSIKVFRGGALEESIPYARLGLLEASDLAYADGWLYVADAPGAQVAMLRVQPAPKAAK
jgi:hypothetical protein